MRPDNNARAAAEREGVEIKLYKIIYEAVEDVRAALEGMLRPEEREVVLGEAEVRELFKVPRIGVIAGCSVRSGVINRQGRVRVIRDSVEIYDGTIASLRRFKDDVKEVREGFECGIGVENFNDIKVGDVHRVLPQGAGRAHTDFSGGCFCVTPSPRGPRRRSGPRRSRDLPHRIGKGSADRRLRHRDGRRDHARSPSREASSSA